MFQVDHAHWIETRALWSGWEVFEFSKGWWYEIWCKILRAIFVHVWHASQSLIDHSTSNFFYSWLASLMQSHPEVEIFLRRCCIRVNIKIHIVMFTIWHVTKYLNEVFSNRNFVYLSTRSHFFRKLNLNTFFAWNNPINKTKLDCFYWILNFE